MRCTRRKIAIRAGAPIIGIDVGEDYLDLSILPRDRATLSYHRVALRGIANPIAHAIAKRIAAVASLNLRDGVAFIDSPRVPLDVDCSGARFAARSNAPSGREIDSALRALLQTASKSTRNSLSMFPTPRAEYFAGCMANAACKPHLRAIGGELLASLIPAPQVATTGRTAGGTFTRFMLAGFGVFPALERLGIRSFEAYSDLAMRLWLNGAGAHLPPKRHREALRVRRAICSRLAGIVGVPEFEPPATLDEADAAVLALSAAASASRDSLVELHCPAEGRFAVAFTAFPKAAGRCPAAWNAAKRSAIASQTQSRRYTSLSKREFKAVFFDLDGTLVDIHGPLYLAARKALDDLGQTPALTRERYWQAIAEDDRMLGVPEHLQRDFAKLAFAYFMAEADATERMDILPHVPETLAALKRRGYATAVITSRPGDPNLLLKKLAMVGLASYLDHVVTQDTTSLLRALDKSESLRATAKRAEVAPQTCVYVGDEPRDIMAAMNAGFGAAIAVATGPATYEHLRTHPEYRPHHVMRSMAELLDVIQNFKAEAK